jgi:hypothetical protein
MKFGTIVFVAAVIAAIAYSMNRGLFIGSTIVQFDGAGGRYWGRECRYLFPSGIIALRKGGWYTEAEAENEFCFLFLH